MKNVTDILCEKATNYFGVWAVEPRWFGTMFAAFKADKLVSGRDALGFNTSLYAVDDSGIATFALNGPLMKGDSKYGGTSTLRVRRAVRMMLTDSDVKGAMMMVDSPGGHVAGTDELAMDLAAFAKQKPLHAHAEGVIASAAYWEAVQAHRLTATRMTDVGSIGVVAVVYDTSEMFAKEGVRSIVISSSDIKGAFADGTEITDEHVAYLQGLIDNNFAIFRDTVRKGRGMTAEQLKQVDNGQVWIAEDARKLGLIDAVATIDDAYMALRKEVSKRDTDNRLRNSKRMAVKKALDIE